MISCARAMRGLRRPLVGYVQGADRRPGLPDTWDHRTQLRDELLNGETFETRWEATVLIECWRRTYNQIRPHSALGNHPPAPEAREPRDVPCV